MTTRFERVARWLLSGTLAYNVFEGLIAIASGLRAGSLVLVAFGADSYLEVAASAVVLWRLSIRDEHEAAERRAQRVIGVTFLLLSAAIAVEAAVSLEAHEQANTSLLGIALLAASVVFMPVLSLAKLWAAARAQLPALAAESRESVACAYLSLTALTGLLATAALRWWWLDSVAALLMIPWLLNESRECLQAEGGANARKPCFCSRCWYGLREMPDHG
jgi:divalent metal cation (Fe/Co/Zn/Cd) transporter